MAIPFQPLTTDQLKIYFRKMIDRNCYTSDTNKCRGKSKEAYNGNNPCCPGKILETWVKRQKKQKSH